MANAQQLERGDDSKFWGIIAARRGAECAAAVPDNPSGLASLVYAREPAYRGPKLCPHHRRRPSVSAHTHYWHADPGMLASMFSVSFFPDCLSANGPATTDGQRACTDCFLRGERRR